MIRPRLTLAALLATVTAGAPAIAQTPVVWTGASTLSDFWSDVGNFSPGRPLGPLPTDEVIFNSLSTARLTSNVMDGSYNINKLTVVNPPGNVTVNFAAATDTLTVTGGGVDLSAAGSTNLTFNPRFALGADHTWVVASGRTLNMTGQVNSGGFSRNLTLNVNGAVGTAGTIILGAASNFTAGSTLTTRNGELRLNNAGALNGLTGGVTINPLSTGASGVQFATMNLNTAGTYANVPLNLNSSSNTLRSRVQGTVGGVATLPGAVSLAGTSSGIIEMNVLSGSNLTLNGAVSGATYGGTLQLGGASGNGFLNNTVTLSTTNTGTVRKQDAGVWTLAQANAATAWGTTRVATGTLRVAAANALPAGASLVLGEGTTAGTLDLFAASASQTVTGLSTNTDATVNPATNQLGIGFTGPGSGSSTLTFNGGTSTFAGILANNVGSGVNNTLTLSLIGGELILGATNSYSGQTFIDNSSTLRLTRVVTGAFTNDGSIANSPVINLNNTLSGLHVIGVVGGANFDAGSGRFAPVANQTIRGIGTVTGNVAVPTNAALLGGSAVNPTGTLTVAGNVVFRGATGTTGGRYAVDLGGTSVSGSVVSKVAVTGAGNVVNFDSSAGPVVIPLLSDGGLALSVPYSFVIGSAAGGYQVNGGPVGVGGYTYLTDFVLTSSRPEFHEFRNVSLTPDGSNNLVLSFTPVPEPATVLGLAAAGLAAVRLGRRRILAG